MTDRELFEQALEALEEINKLSIGDNAICLPAEIDGSMDALRERLAQPEPAPGYCPHCKQYTIEEPMRREWVGLMRGVRVEGGTVVITVKGGNEAARELCGALIEEMNK